MKPKISNVEPKIKFIILVEKITFEKKTESTSYVKTQQ